MLSEWARDVGIRTAVQLGIEERYTQEINISLAMKDKGQREHTAIVRDLES